MKTNDFNFKLPDELIAQYPAEKRSNARMLVYYRDSGVIVDSYVSELTSFIDDSYHLVFNNSKVIPCRVKIKKVSNLREGELLITKIIDANNIISLTDSNKKYPNGTLIELPDGSQCTVEPHDDPMTRIIHSSKPLFTIDFFDEYGAMPLPPYIKKVADEFDKQRYQTVFGKNYGSSAAPTAGLHFDEDMFNKFKKENIGYSFVSLHVGLGTFQPIYSEEIEEHSIHEEEYDIEEQSANDLNEAIKTGKKILPVGTTSLRTIESAYKDSKILSGIAKTKLYITPGYTLKVASGLFTNFHTPKSSLAVLVASIVGYENFNIIYNYAIKEKYRFFSYGDSMLIL